MGWVFLYKYILAGYPARVTPNSYNLVGMRRRVYTFDLDRRLSRFYIFIMKVSPVPTLTRIGCSHWHEYQEYRAGCMQCAGCKYGRGGTVDLSVLLPGTWPAEI